MKKKSSKPRIINIASTGSSINIQVRMSFNTWKRFLWVLLILGAGWTFLSRVPASAQDSGELPASPRIGFPAPDFTLDLLDGSEMTLSDFKGQVVLVNLWASWCPPCRTEMPAIEAAYQAYEERGFVVLGVNTTDQDSEQDAAAFVQQIGVTFPILLDRSGEVSRAYQLRGLPTSYFIDRDGIIRAIVVGGPMSEVVIRTNIETLLEQP
jgi:peroxiredoxin